MPAYSLQNQTPKQLCEMRGQFYRQNRGLCRQALGEKGPGQHGPVHKFLRDYIASAPVGGPVAVMKIASKIAKAKQKKSPGYDLEKLERMSKPLHKVIHEGDRGAYRKPQHKDIKRLDDWNTKEKVAAEKRKQTLLLLHRRRGH